MPPIAFSIRYSVARGYEQAALGLARRLFAVYDTGIDAQLTCSVDDIDTAGAFFYLPARLIGRPLARDDDIGRYGFDCRGIGSGRRDKE